MVTSLRYCLMCDLTSLISKACTDHDMNLQFFENVSFVNPTVSIPTDMYDFLPKIMSNVLSYITYLYTLC